MAEGLDTLTLPVLPLSGGVVLPQMVLTIAIESDEARRAAEAAAAADNQILLLPRLGSGAYARVGTVATIEDRGDLPGGTPGLVVRATNRAVVGAGVIGRTAALWLEVDVLDDPPATARTSELAADLRASLGALFESIGSRRLREVLRSTEDPGGLADQVGWWPELSHERRIELLETIDVEERLITVLVWVKEALAEREVSESIRREVSDTIDRSQRELILRQQLVAIRKELGEGEGEDGDLVDGYRQRLTGLVAEGALTDAARQAVEREIGRLERTPSQQVEHGWIRAWLDTVFEVPWGQRSEDHLDIDAARQILDDDHTGLDEVKERIVELLAVRKLRAERDGDLVDPGTGDGAGRRAPGTIIALVGPPGVGKTSLGQSVARALGRRFVRVALGGVRDEADIRGHRRTYVGAQAGRIVRALQDAGTMNPVFLLDEIDKVGSDWRGDPSSALLEVLDPAQNHGFRDHYLEIDLDLSDVLFITTANVVDSIPAPLLDRMEIVRLDGYTDAEKVAIARDHLVARQVGRHGLHADEVVLTDDALDEVVTGYTREAGVRSLEREVAKLLRKVATQVAGGAPTPVLLDRPQVRDFLGRRRFTDEVRARVAVPGVATGLAVTGAGGDVLFVETTAMEGDAGLTVTGQLGDVMKESAQIALSHVRSRADALGIDRARLDRRIHVHFPAGAVPKDGPSAGVTMTTALVSLLTDRAVRPDVGMTGEVTLQGRVLPVGGIKQKVLAAHRAGLTEVILPVGNEADLDDVPAAARQAMTFHLATDVGEVLEWALEPAAAGVSSAP